MKGNNSYQLSFVLVAIGIHLLLLYSIFDVYFTSPVINNLQPQPTNQRPLASRLVLFVADGLRAQSLYHDKMSQTPYLAQIVEKRGKWGISHTRVPTESRPGHVALIAGFYEDVASVTKGWQSNAVEFDSVFNRSSHTWAWGSPDVVPMFQRGAVHGRVSIDVYNHQLEDFAANDTWKLDTWVFQRVEKFFEAAKKNDSLNVELRQEKVVLFLHLLGLDTSGHSHKPGSAAFHVNLAEVDKGIEKMEKLINEFYHNDGQTAFIFTSDHGMTDWGSHGAGSDHETVTPFIAWGSGILSPSKNQSINSFSNFNGPSFVKLNESFTLPSASAAVSAPISLWQADVCPLMSALLGLPIPVNSVGRVVLPMLDVNGKEAVQILRENTLQIVAQFKAKRLEKKSESISILFKEFEHLSPTGVEETLQLSAKFARDEKFNESIVLLNDLMNVALSGIDYFHKYHRFNLGLCILLCFILWICLCFSEVDLAPNYSSSSSSTLTSATSSLSLFSIQILKQNSWQNILLGFGLILQSLWLLCEHRALTHWLYHWAWTLLAWCLLHRLHQLKNVFISLFHRPILIILLLLIVEMLIFSFFNRSLLTYAAWLLGIAIMFNMDLRFISKFVWSISFVFIGIFPRFSVVSGLNLHLLFLGSFSSIFICISFYFFIRSKLERFQKWFFILIILQLITATLVMICVRYFLMTDIVFRILSWFILLVSLATPCLVQGNNQHKFIFTAFSLCAVFILMSLSYEVLFFLAVIFHCYLWINCSTCAVDEISASAFRPTKSIKSNLMTALIFVFLLYLCFFGTGNIASLNTFDPTSVYCFVTVFNPFVMGAVLIMKIVIPMFLVSAAYCVVHQASASQWHAQFCLLIVISDLVACHFFFFIRDWGSWLDIGSSISHYVIAMATSLVAILLTTIAKKILRLSIKTTLAAHNLDKRQRRDEGHAMFIVPNRRQTVDLFDVKHDKLS